MTKYIVIEINHRETIIIFPGFIKHKDMALRVLQEGERILSAGFISFGEPKGCFGESVGLRLGTRPAKDNLLLTAL